MTMSDLVDAAVSIEGRVLFAERALTDVKVTVARIDEKLENHEQIVKEFREENNKQFDELKTQITSQTTNITRQLEPLKEAKWKATGAYSMLAAVVSAGISLAIKLFWK
jgi:sigma54-dependent transcription regulator